MSKRFLSALLVRALHRIVALVALLAAFFLIAIGRHSQTVFERKLENSSRIVGRRPIRKAGFHKARCGELRWLFSDRYREKTFWHSAKPAQRPYSSRFAPRRRISVSPCAKCKATLSILSSWCCATWIVQGECARFKITADQRPEDPL
jgi:hypothetical protein